MSRRATPQRAPGYEPRLAPVSFEVRAQGDETESNAPQTRELVGRIPYESLSLPLGFMDDFREQFLPGAFTSTIREDQIVALFNHDPDNLLGVSDPEDGRETLRFADGKDSLEFVVDLPDTETARTVEALVARGDLRGNSFGFVAVRDEWDYTDEENVLRTVAEARLFDVGPVTFPAYPASENEMRDLLSPRACSKLEGMRLSKHAARRHARRRLDAIRLQELEA